MSGVLAGGDVPPMTAEREVFAEHAAVSRTTASVVREVKVIMGVASDGVSVMGDARCAKWLILRMCIPPQSACVAELE